MSTVDAKTRNILNLYKDATFFSVAAAVAGTFLPVYALRLGASSQDMGLLSALPALVTMLWIVPAGRLLERHSDILRPVLVHGLLQRVQYLLLALVAFLPAGYSVPALITVVTLGAMAGASSSVAFTSMFAAVVPTPDRARVVSQRNVIAAVVGALTSALGGKLLALLPLPWNYQFLFMVAFLASLVSTYSVSRIEVPPQPAKPPSPRPAGGLLQVRTAWAGLRAQQDFGRYTLATFVAAFFVNLPVPLYALYWVRVLYASETWVGLMATVSAVVTVVVFPFWGRFAERHGNRPTLLIGALGLALYPLTTALTPSQEFLLIPAVLGAIFTPPYSLALYNGLLEVVPADRRPTYIALHTAASNLAAFVAPLLATGLALPLLGLQGALLLGAAGRVTGWLVLHLVAKRKEPSPQTA